MPAPIRSRHLKKSDFQQLFKPLKPTLFSESPSPRPSTLIQKITSISWSATGSLLATCTTSNIRIWNPERANVKSSTELRNAHPKHGAAFGTAGVSGDAVEKVAFCPDRENVLASTGADGMVRVWDVRVPGGATGVAGRGTPVGDVRIGDSGIFLTWHPGGDQLLASRKDDMIHCVDVRQCLKGKDEKGNKDIFYQLSFSNSGREVFAPTADGVVKIFDYPTFTHLHTLSGHTATAYCVRHSPAGSHVAVGSADSTISLWDTTSWFCSGTLNAPSQLTSVKDMSFSFDGQYLVAGSGSEARDGLPGLNVYHVDTGEVALTVETANCPTFVAWHPGRYWVAYAGDPGGLKVVGAGSGI
ncbi:WD40 repeat-like protein [Teratosphaeria nubilosa]|uniref:WD40 repeat-like protein n=1 Tax=Teratosphaeria nubilosa TaxID=161662 RepID=A0A6G1KTR1_9PEZI|nr:WD40 repeat-like protein [Teratosphaeria nubilosa]